MNLNEAIKKIKKVGASNVRVVPMPNQSIKDGDHQVEIKEGSNWLPIVTGIKKQMAENLVSQAVNKVILG